MKKKLPKPGSDKEAEEFVSRSGPTNYDLSKMQTVRFEFPPKANA